MRPHGLLLLREEGTDASHDGPPQPPAYPPLEAIAAQTQNVETELQTGHVGLAPLRIRSLCTPRSSDSGGTTASLSPRRRFRGQARSRRRARLQRARVRVDAQPARRTASTRGRRRRRRSVGRAGPRRRRRGGRASAEGRRLRATTAGSESARARARRSPFELPRRAVGERLGDVLGVHRVRAGERGDGARDASDACTAASRERQPVDRARKQLVRLRRPGRRRPGARCNDAAANRLGRLPVLQRELDCARPRHGDDEIEPVEQRPRELVAESRQPLRRARTFRSRIATRTARAEVNGRLALPCRLPKLAHLCRVPSAASGTGRGSRTFVRASRCTSSPFVESPDLRGDHVCAPHAAAT